MPPDRTCRELRSRLCDSARALSTAALCSAVLFLAASTAHGETAAERALALVKSQDLQQLRAYLAQPGVGIDDQPGGGDKTLLDFAAELNVVTVVEFLLVHGADVNHLSQRQFDKMVNAPGISPLCYAGYFNAVEAMELLLQRGAAVNTGKNTESPLICAASQGNLKAVQLLVERGADIDHQYGPYQTASSLAIQNNHFEVARYLIDRGAKLQPADVIHAATAGSPELVELVLSGHPAQDMLNAALAAAAGNDHVDEPNRQRMLGSLLRQGADPDAAQNGLPNGMLSRAATAATAAFLLDRGANSTRRLTGYDLASAFVCTNANKDPLPMLKLLVERHMDFATPGVARTDPMQCAIRKEAIDVIDYLVDHGANVNQPDWNGLAPIFYARSRVVVQDLLRHGADLNQTGAQRGFDGRMRQLPLLTPLSNAIETSQWDTVNLLVSMGADVHVGGPRYLAGIVMKGPLDVAATLLDAGVDINARNEIGETALMAAVRVGRIDGAEFLLAHGAAIDIQNKEGRTALGLAVEANSLAMMKMLLGHGARRDIADAEGFRPSMEARSSEMRILLAGLDAVPPADHPSTQEYSDCVAALSASVASADTDSAPRIRERGEDWDWLDRVGEPVQVTVGDRKYWRGVSGAVGYLGRVDADGVERVVCEYGEDRKFHGGIRPLSEYERLQARSRRDVQSISVESTRLQGLRGAVAILDASRRRYDPVPLQLNSDGNLLGEAAVLHRDDILAYYLENGVDPNLGWLAHPTVNGNDNPDTPAPALLSAVAAGSERSVELLLEHGAQPDATGPPSPLSKPAIAVAVLGRSPALVEDLLAHGANPDIPEGRVPPSGVGIYRNFHDELGGEVDQWVHGRLFNPRGPAQDLVATASVLFRHGASADPWLNTVLGELRVNSVAGLLPMAVRAEPSVSPDAVQVRQVAEEIRASYPDVADLLDVALEYRDSPLCTASTTPEDLPYCLPRSLHSADDELNDLYSRMGPGASTGALHRAQRAWIHERDESCGVEELPNITEAGWLAYVLTDLGKAECVLKKTRARAAQFRNGARFQR